MPSFTRLQIKILSLLVDASSPMHSQEISERIHVSTRSIKKNIGELNDQLSRDHLSILTSTHQGYWIDSAEKQQFGKLIHEQEAQLLRDDPDHRLIAEGMLLLLVKEPMTVQELANRLSISKAAVSMDFSRLKEIALAAKGVELSARKTGGYTLTGKESAIRHFFASLISLYYDTDHRYLKHAFAEIFHMNALLNPIHDLLATILLKENILLTDRALTIFTLEVLFSAYRYMGGKEIEVIPSPEWERQDHCRLIDQNLGTSLSDAEYSWLETRLASHRYLEQDLTDLSRDRYQVNACLGYLDALYGLDFRDNQMLKDYLIILMHYDQEPMRIDSFSAEDHPFAAKLSNSMCGMLISREHQLSRESRDSLTALLSVLLNERVRKQQVILLTELNYADQEYLAYRISAHFGHYLDILGVYPLYSIVAKDLFNACDFCICTSQKLLETTYSSSLRKISCDILYISPFLTYSDFRIVEHYIHDHMPSRKGMDPLQKDHENR